MKMKELFQEKLPVERCLDICDFVEELYLSDCDLLILMARKFYNLFCVFHELNCEKYKQLGVSYENQKKIVTNRALPVLEKEIREGVYKKIIIADDIIIHGRTVRDVYDELKAINSSLDIRVMSYVRNHEKDNRVLETIPADRILPRYVVEVDEWRTLSNEIVTSFYLTGRPYISYLPYFLLDIGWDELKKRFSLKDRIPIQNRDMEMLNVDAWIYMGNELAIFKNVEECNVCGIRFYYYKQVSRLLAIPYCCMGEIEKEDLQEKLYFLRSNYLRKEYTEKIGAGSQKNDMGIMELEYVLSTWMAMYLFDKKKIAIKKWVRDTEEYNFSERLLPDAILSSSEVQERMEKICWGNQNLKNNKSMYSEDVEILRRHFEELLDKYRSSYSKWTACEENETHNYVLRIMGHFESVNGNLDEEKCREEGKPKRLFGLPVSFILDRLAKLLLELQGGDLEEKIKQAFAAIMTVVDAGLATIVTKYIEETGVAESIIYSGEQKYKFYEITNFPAMYGLYLIEEKIAEKPDATDEDLNKAKKNFVNQYLIYMDDNKVFYTKGEVENLAAMHLKQEYGKFLRNSYKKYYGEPLLQNAIELALGSLNDKGYERRT